MKILFIAQGYPPERVGGVEVYLRGLAAELAREHEVFVFSRAAAKGREPGRIEEREDGKVRLALLPVDTRRLNGFRDIYAKAWVDDLFTSYLTQVQPDVIHVQHLGGLSLGMIGAAHALGVPVVMSLHDHQPFCPRGQRIRNDKRVCKTINLDECLECMKPQTAGLPSRTAKLTAYLLGKTKGLELLRAMHAEISESFAKVSAFIMPSEFHRRIMAEAGVPEEKSMVMPCGLNLAALDQVPPRPDGAPVRKFGYLGTLIPSKGVEDVIRAFKKMKTQGCSVHIYGEAVPYHGVSDYDKRLIEMARSADISFYGPYQPEDLPRVLSRVDAVVIPSRWYESYGITIREAFRARRPVIVSDAGAFAEAVEHEKNGLLFPPGDVFALAEAMDLLASDPGLAQRLAQTGGPITGLADHARELVALYGKIRGG